MWQIAMLTTAIGLLLSVHGQVNADGLPPDVAGGSVEGTVRKVDVVTGTIQVSSGLLGLVEKTLQLSEETYIDLVPRFRMPEKLIDFNPRFAPLALGKEPRHDNDRD